MCCSMALPAGVQALLPKISQQFSPCPLLDPEYSICCACSEGTRAVCMFIDYEHEASTFNGHTWLSLDCGRPARPE